MAIELGRPSQHQPALTKEEILFTASRLIAKDGYNNTHVDEIVNQAGYSKGAFYFHFSNKENMATGVIRRAADIYLETLNSKLADKEDYKDRICALLDTEKLLYLRPDLNVIYVLLGEAQIKTPELLTSVRHFFKKKRDLYLQIINDNIIADRLFIAVLGGVMQARIEGQEVFNDTIDQLKQEFARPVNNES